jgi:hypothetical protein
LRLIDGGLGFKITPEQVESILNIFTEKQLLKASLLLKACPNTWY